MFEALSNAFAEDAMAGSFMLCLMLWALFIVCIVTYYFAGYAYQWINDSENKKGSRWLLFKSFRKISNIKEYSQEDYILWVLVVGSCCVPWLIALLLAAVLTVPWLFTIILSILAIMKLARGVVRLKKKLNKHINDNDAHKES